MLQKCYVEGWVLSWQHREPMFPQHHALTQWLAIVEFELGKKLQTGFAMWLLTERWGKLGRDCCAVSDTMEGPLKPSIKGSAQGIPESLICRKPMLWTTGLGFPSLPSASPFTRGLCSFSGCSEAKSAILEPWNRRHNK